MLSLFNTLVRKYFLSSLIYFIYRFLWFTWNIRFIEPPEMLEDLKNGTPFIIAHWHGDELAMMHIARRYQVCTITSTSKDGELMNAVLNWMGCKTSRGSSTRGGVGAVRGLIRLIRAGLRPSFAVDGPKGPIYKVKPGVFEVSKLCNLKIFPTGVSCDRAWHFPKSWNQTYLPKPFAKITLFYGEPIAAISNDLDPRDQGLAEDLEKRLHAAKQDALSI